MTRSNRLPEKKRVGNDATVYAHFPCFDGLVPAVLAANYLEKALGWNVERFEPVNYERSRTWRSQRLPLRSAVVDFLYHPDPFMWADHHLTTFIEPADRAALNGSTDRLLLYDASSPSCALLLWNNLAGKLSSPTRFGEMAPVG